VRDQVASRLAEDGIEPIGWLREDRELPVLWLSGSALEGTEIEADAARIVDAIADRVAAGPPRPVNGRR